VPVIWHSAKYVYIALTSLLFFTPIYQTPPTPLVAATSPLAANAIGARADHPPLRSSPPAPDTMPAILPTAARPGHLRQAPSPA
jgi:hypothetical protein